MKNNKQQVVIIEMKDDKVYMKHQSGNVGLTVDVTSVFNFGMFIQSVLDKPADEVQQKYLDYLKD